MSITARDLSWKAVRAASQLDEMVRRRPAELEPITETAAALEEIAQSISDMAYDPADFEMAMSFLRQAIAEKLTRCRPLDSSWKTWELVRFLKSMVRRLRTTPNRTDRRRLEVLRDICLAISKAASAQWKSPRTLLAA